MKHPIQISIPTPCHENRGKINPADKGRFCVSCQKTVRDFTQASDREIVEALKTGVHACGRFRASQLGRDLIVPKEKSQLWIAASTTAISLLALGTNEVSAQTPVITYLQEPGPIDINTNNLPDGFKIIAGIVEDEMGMPIPGTDVTVKGSDAPAVQTDFDGRFFIEAKEGDVIEFKYIGMKMETIKVSEHAKFSIVMEEAQPNLENVIVEGYMHYNFHISVASEFLFNR
ncbi:carboxypeptidase-like regulatory domain-containing protein [Flavobacterium sp. DGU11]|uniref:Carboxypeptidase-like regulatory domain-containing protein n=1 Tax=Flavobacterium arundinis TaxID=3139143 RepID=A0ABU9HSW2_9FLAO